MREPREDAGTGGGGGPASGISARQLLRMLDHVPGMIAWWDPDLRNRFANRAFAEWFGGTPEQLLGTHMRDVLGAEVFAVSEQYATCALTGERSIFERVLFDRAGEPRSTTTHYVPATVDGEPAGFFVLVADISTRSRVERALEESVRQMALLEERQRIAADLHDLVIQRLFAAGLDLQAVRRHGLPASESRLSSAAVGVDEGIRELRRAIHSLREVSTPKQVPALIERVLGNVSRVLGFVPTMTYSGTLDRVPEVVLQDLLAVVNEALSNVARHAGATAVSVELAGSAEEVVLRVADDGRGTGPTTRSSGLANMRDRAERHGGTFSLGENRPRGTVLEWQVPLGGSGVRPSRQAYVDGRPPEREAPEEPRQSSEGPQRRVTARALLQMLDELPALVSAYDDQGRNLYANRAHQEYYGVDPAVVRGRHVSEVLGSTLYEASRRQLNEALTGRSQHFERTLHDSSGRERHMQVHYVPDVVDGEPRGFYCLATDISARVRAEEALDQSTRQMTLLEERQRIAANLHDMVIQRLFAAGLDLAAAQRGRPDAQERLAQAADAVDQSIRELRGAIHSLRELMVPRQLPASIEAVIGQVSQQLGFVPTVTYTGSLDVVPEGVVSDLIGVVDEALTDVARHANASAVVVVLACSSDHVVAQVVDDGEGPGATAGRDRVSGMRARAERHGGSLSLRRNHPHGTVVEWMVPLR